MEKILGQMHFLMIAFPVFLMMICTRKLWGCCCSEEGKTAILILPIVALEPQVEADMTRLGLKYVSLTCSPVDSLEEKIRITKPHVLLSNVESLTSPDIQRRISKLKISYIAVDEAQVRLSLTFFEHKTTL